MAQKEKSGGFFSKLLHPYPFLDMLSSDRYKSLKIRIFLIVNAIAGIPLILVIAIGYFWLQSILKEELHTEVELQLGRTLQAIEVYLQEKLAGSRFLASANGYARLSDAGQLRAVFLECKKEFGELAALEVVDAHGIRRAHAGPYRPATADYSGQKWFRETIAGGLYISDIFKDGGHDPYFVIAIRHGRTEADGVWVLRAVLGMESINRYIASLTLKGKDDAFIINRNNILQTSSRFHGKALERLSLDVPLHALGITMADIELPDGNAAVYGYAPIGNSPFVLGVVINSTVDTRIRELFRNKQSAIYLTALLIFLAVMVSIRMAHTLVSSIREADQKKEEAIAESEHANKLASIGRLATGIAHEINNPLAIINEKAGLMKDIIELSDDFRQREKFLSLIGGISDSVSRCRTITHRLLGFARKMDVVSEVIDLNDALREVIGFLEKEMLYRDIRLELNLVKGLPRIQSDRSQLQQVFLNIINNALDAVPDGGLIAVSTDFKDTYTVKTIIKDNGHGIPRDKLKHIFDPFFTTKEKGKGTGLGLAISYGIMKKLGGTILVESEEGRGATFTVEIPIIAKPEKEGAA